MHSRVVRVNFFFTGRDLARRLGMQCAAGVVLPTNIGGRAMRVLVSVAVVLVLVLGAPAAIVAAGGADCAFIPFVCAGQWQLAGQNVANTHAQPQERRINVANVHDLKPRWTFPTNASQTSVIPTNTSDVSATPTVAGDTVYFPDWGGWLYAVDARTGKKLWEHLISDYTGVKGSFSRTSPAIAGDLLILGDKPPSGSEGWGQTSGIGAHIFAVNARTGKLVWMTQVDNTFVSQITASPVVFGDIAYVGVSSVEEVTSALVPGYTCCIFRGSEVALDVHTGRILWKTYVVPQGYTGGAIWGSTAAVDPATRAVYVGTGNNYSVPDAVRTCQQQQATNCTSPDDHFDSIMALDMHTGAIKWATGTLQFDNWTVSCLVPPQLPNCPDPNSPDADFGSGPNLFSAHGRVLVGAGTKGGTYWTLDAATGQIVWATQAGPGGIFGGIEWGSSVADGKIYVAIANSGHKPTTLTHPSPGSTSSTDGGFWEALDAASGNILWQTPDPAGQTFGAIAQTATANGVVYVASTDAAGNVYALDGSTGAIKWHFATGGSVAAGASIVNGTVYWGSGYGQFLNSKPQGTTGNNKVYAFSLPDGRD